MATRVVEWKKPYTWGKAISIDENKVISLNLRDENNLIIYDAGDDEIYVDLQLDDEITPTSAFPIWVNVGRVIVDNWWDKPWTIISAETTSGDNIKIFYADEWTLWIDNWTGTFKQIYFKADVDALLLALRNYIDWELAKKQNWVSSDTAPSNPSEWDLWYDTTNNAMKVWDWTAWQSVGTGWGGSDIEYVTQAEYNALLPWALTDNKHYFIYTPSVVPTIPTDHLLWYYKLNNNANDDSWNGNDGTWSWTAQYVTVGWYTWASFTNQSNKISLPITISDTPLTLCLWAYCTWINNWRCLIGNPNWDRNDGYAIRAITDQNNSSAIVISNWTSSDISIGQNVYTDNQWFSITLVIDSTSTKIYKDWTLYSTVSAWWQASDYTNFYIASYWSYTNQWWDGYIRDVAIYNKALTDNEVSQYITATT